MLYRDLVLRDLPLAYYPLVSNTALTELEMGSDRGGLYQGSVDRTLTWNAATVGARIVPGAPSAGVLLGGTQEASLGNQAWQEQNTLYTEAWFQTTATGVQAIWCRRQTSGPWGVYHDTSGVIFSGGVNGLGLVIRQGVTNYSVTTGGTTYNDGRLHHAVIGWYDDGANTQVEIFVDGALVTGPTSPFSGTISLNDDPLRIGGENGIRRWNGGLAHCALYDHRLDAGRVGAHHNAGRTLRRSRVFSGTGS